MVTPDAFKPVMRRWASTVNVVTTRHDDRIHGLTVTAFSSLQAAPPMVFVCVNRATRTHPMIAHSGIFCVNFLSPEMSHISDRFAGRVPEDVEKLIKADPDMPVMLRRAREQNVTGAEFLEWLETKKKGGK